MKTNPHEPVYPDPVRSAEAHQFLQDPLEFPTGINLRQHYAGQAMQGLLASCDWNVSVLDDSLIETTAIKSVKLADALINALNKED